MLTKFDIIRIDDHPKGRHYRTPEGNVYPSVTNVLSKIIDKSGLEEWRKSIGDKKADEIVNEAATLGTGVHDLCERYLLGEKLISYKENPLYFERFIKIRKVLDKYVTNVIGIEHPLYSDTLKIAGSCDTIADFYGNLAIIDYKNVRSLKTESDCYQYFLQETIYGFCLKEMYDLEPKLIVTIITVKDHNEPIVFIKKYSDYKDEIYGKIEKVWKLFEL